MTLDHVAPRRGQDAYDRRDNLVMCCKRCNTAKRDQSPLAFLLAARSRALNLVKYGDHLSDMLYDLARSLVPAEQLPPLRSPEHNNGNRRAESNGSAQAMQRVADDDDSPYLD